MALPRDHAGLTYNSGDDLDWALVEDNSLIVNPVNRTLSQWRGGGRGGIQIV